MSFGMIYDSLNYTKEKEPKHRLAIFGLMRKKCFKKTAKRAQEQNEKGQGDYQD